MLKYDLEGNLIEILEAKSFGGLTSRFQDHGFMYRDYYIFKEKYNEIPNKIEKLPDYYFTKQRKIVKKYDINKNFIEEFNGYPKDYNKDDIYFSIIYNMPDANNYYWTIEKKYK